MIFGQISKVKNLIYNMEVEKHPETEGLLFPATAGHHTWLEEDQAAYRLYIILLPVGYVVKINLAAMFQSYLLLKATNLENISYF